MDCWRKIEEKNRGEKKQEAIQMLIASKYSPSNKQ
jgi:hypothetical protein